MDNNRLMRGIQAAKDGQFRTAQTILAGLVRDEPDNEQAWLWLAVCVEETERKLFCLRQALRINPGNQAVAEEISRLESLDSKPSAGLDLIQESSLSGAVQTEAASEVPPPAKTPRAPANQPAQVPSAFISQMEESVTLPPTDETSEPAGSSVPPLPPSGESQPIVDKVNAQARSKKPRRTPCMTLLLIFLFSCILCSVVGIAGTYLLPGLLDPLLLIYPTFRRAPAFVQTTDTPSAALIPTHTPSSPPTVKPTFTSTNTPTPLASNTPVPSPTPLGGGGSIAFVSDRTFNDEIYSLSPDGSGLINLSRNRALESHPIWSPDGTKLLFASSLDTQCQDQQACSEAWILDVNTGTMERATNFGSAIVIPQAWIPDGRIAVNVRPAQNPGADYDLYLVKPGSAGPGLLKDVAGWAWLKEIEGNLFPSWSPDGNRALIPVNNPADGSADLILVNADGSDPRSVAPEGLRQGEIASVAWSPDSKWIALAHKTGEGLEAQQVIYIMRPEGTGLRVLTDVGTNSHPTWSPDGRRIAFASDRDGNWEIYIINAYGSELIRLTSFNARDEQPSWSPK